jgi:ABC-type glycerol-3-phosphate transport system substrate-binding protein
MSTEKKIEEKKPQQSRRNFLKYVGGAVGVAVVAGAAYGIYETTKAPPTPPTPATTVPATTVPATTVPATTVPATTGVVIPHPNAKSPGYGLKAGDMRAYDLILDSAKTKIDGTKISICYDEPPADPLTVWGPPLWKKAAGVDLGEKTLIPLLNMRDKLETQFTMGTASYDLVSLWPMQINEFIAKKWVMPLDDYFDEFGYPGMDDVLPLFRYVYCQPAGDGKTYGTPIDGDVLCFDYRTDIFGDPDLKSKFESKYKYPFEIPKTWEDAADMAEFITDQLGSKGTYGTQLFGKDIFLWAWYGNIYHSFGHNWWDEDLTPTLDVDGDGVRSLNLLKRLMKASPPGVMNYSVDETIEAFLAGHVAFTLWWPDLWEFAHSSYLGSKIIKVHDIGPCPGVKGKEDKWCTTAPVGRMLVVPTNAKHPEAAYWVAQAMGGQTDLRLAMQTDPYNGLDTVAYSEYARPEWFLKKNPFRNPNGDTKPNDANVDPAIFGQDRAMEMAKRYMDMHKEAVLHAVPQPTWLNAYSYMLELAHQVSAFLLDTKSADQALKDAAASFNSLTDDIGRNEQKAVWSIIRENYKKAQITTV